MVLVSLFEVPALAGFDEKEHGIINEVYFEEVRRHKGTQAPMFTAHLKVF